uniref:Ig-like domain-containing protein n=1 Tax=Pseudonaja textilis TaxID=8673 RepID=A0A670YVJ2_PSETE
PDFGAAISWQLAQSRVFPDIQLIESGPGMVRPGSQLNLVCKVTGFSTATSSSYAWHWVRQPPGKHLEWLSAINVNNGGKWYATSVKSRVTISADQSRNEFSLQVSSIVAADSSVYFCF